MSCYISSTNNRFYTALEVSYGQVPPVTAGGRIPAVKLAIRQEPDVADRKDKTGSRTYFGLPSHTRRQTSYELKTYLTNWPGAGQEPAYGPLFQAALGGAPAFYNGGAAGEGSSGKTLRFGSAHGLAVGQAVTFGGEIRFVSAIVDGSSVIVNAPFSLLPVSGSPIGATVTYFPTAQLRSASIWDYWDPPEAVQRLLCGAGVDEMRIQINGEFHEFTFRGAAMDVIDDASFTAGQGGLSSYPLEPTGDVFDYTIIPGHLGQAWLGSAPDQFFTITGAEVVIDNNLDLRAREFGAQGPRCLAAGMRSVTVNFDLYEVDDQATRTLYQAARQQSPIEVMFQLGQEAGQLFGVYMKSVVPLAPEFDDSEARLQWRFTNCRAQGNEDDEVVVAFG
jgi:hypothetical protein